jgi:DNA polymerase elongation subunit (family B)
MKKNTKILIFDFETSPAKGYFFGGIWETNIIEIIEYEQILSVAWKWYSESKSYVIGQDDFEKYKPGKLNDKDIVEYFYKIISMADVVVAHNGDRFDLTVFNARLLFYGLDPIPPSKSIDTKKISKNKFHLPSNKLDDIADFLNIGRKTPHTGKNMWLECEAGNKKAWALMKKYNKNDIILLESVLKMMLPFTKHNSDFVSIWENREINCPNPTCLSKHMIKHGTRQTRTGKKQTYKCFDCGSWWTDTRVLKNEEA